MTQLTKFQHDSLKDAANGNPAYGLACPRVGDCPEHYNRWAKNNTETNELITMGLLEDVTQEFPFQIQFQHGRRYRVLAITDLGKAMFNDLSTCSLSN